MDDLSICQNIAEIEGISLKAFMNHTPVINGAGIQTGWNRYNPLTDDTLCFQLMIKYDLDIIAPYRKNNETTWEAQIFSKDYVDAFQIYDKSPNRAICLAIIEAHKDQS